MDKLDRDLLDERVLRAKPTRSRLAGDRRAIGPPRRQLAHQYHHDGVVPQLVMIVEVLVAEGEPNTRWQTSLVTACSIRSGRRRSRKHKARRSTIPMA